MTSLPLVFIPGLLCDGALWQHQLADLQGLADMQVADITGQDSMTALAQHVLDHAPDRFALAGLSMGGYVALEILRQAPDRVLRLALVDSSARADTDEQKKRRQGLVNLSKTGQFRGVTSRLLPLLIHPDRVQDTELTNIIFGMAERVGRDAYIRQQTAILGRPDSRPGLQAIQCPSLVICGENDALTPPDVAAETAEIIPNARLKIIPNCGHLAPLEQPAQVTEALRQWLA
jgi:pimeloyl-ACP methyl ester carboxylesterase